MSDTKLITKAASFMSDLHRQATYEMGDNPDEVDTVYSTAADALAAVTPLRSKISDGADRIEQLQQALKDQSSVSDRLAEAN